MAFLKLECGAMLSYTMYSFVHTQTRIPIAGTIKKENGGKHRNYFIYFGVNWDVSRNPRKQQER